MGEKIVFTSEELELIEVSINDTLFQVRIADNKPVIKEFEELLEKVRKM